MSSYKKMQEIKKMTDQFSKIEKETVNTEIESMSETGFLITLNVAGDLISIENTKNSGIAKDLEKTFKKIIVAIKDKRLEITNKYKDQIKPGFRGY